MLLLRTGVVDVALAGATEAPVTKARGLMEYICTFTGALDEEGRLDLVVGITVPITTLPFAEMVPAFPLILGPKMTSASLNICEAHINSIRKKVPFSYSAPTRSRPLLASSTIARASVPELSASLTSLISVSLSRDAIASATFPKALPPSST